ncbi:TIGR02996 domain-containing protein [Gemmata sp. JC673]|uniref:TIGR02996 domain-containing protein n=1 Tax=Gemmata algarum TaxID=2975278 RepID=A0ABU5ESM3_9BACT|nr:TIGR02996 domain-containing protein [Gemmata algarum]MDY3558249.1 TIGR02996 domain-containing protein [Gemmata algarum]
MTDPEEAALLRAIGAHPGEVTARLAYADWLDEHGRGIEAAWVRDEGMAPPRVTAVGDGNGDGSGAGYGGGGRYGRGHGHGHGYGDQVRYNRRRADCGGVAHGDGTGRGNGRCLGDGGCDGSGTGDGDGDGHFREPRAAPKLQHLIPHEEVPMPLPGAYVIVRSRDQGCVCGEYRGHHGREVVLGKARQIYSWEGGRLTLFDFAVVPGPCRVSREAPGEVVMLEACGIIPTTPEVEAFLRAHPGE